MTTRVTVDTFQLKRATEAWLEENDPALLAGEQFLNVDNGRTKTGPEGGAHWSAIADYDDAPAIGIAQDYADDQAADARTAAITAAAVDASSKADAAQSAAEETAAGLVADATEPLLPTAGLDAATAARIDDPDSETNARLKAAFVAPDQLAEARIGAVADAAALVPNQVIAAAFELSVVGATAAAAVTDALVDANVAPAIGLDYEALEAAPVDDPEAVYFQALPGVGVTTPVGGSTFQMLPPETGYSLAITGSDDRAILAFDVAGNIVWPPNIGTQGLDPIIKTGDSLTANWPDGLLGAATGRGVIAQGVGGQITEAISARIGSVPALLTVIGNEIPASGPVTVTAYSANPGQLSSDGSMSFAGILAGIPGALLVTKASGTYTVTFTRTTAGYATPCPAASPFTTGWTRRDGPQILCTGRNSFKTMPPATLVGHVTSWLDWLVRPDRALVLSIPPFEGEESGAGALPRGSFRDALDAANAALAAAFPTRWIDIAAHLRSVGTLASVGITATAQDLLDIANGMTPLSFRQDTGHYNPFAYTAIDNLIAAEYAARGWSTD